MNRARKAALLSLCKSTEKGAFSNLEADSTLRKFHDSPEDRKLYTKLYLGVVEKKITLDYLLSRLSSVPLHQMETEVLCILELSAYQILYMDRIPNRAAIFEGGELAKHYAPAALPLINAVLRRLASDIPAALALLEHPGKKGLSLRYGYPRHLIGLWQEAYGKERCLDILEAQNTEAALTLRVNTLKTDLPSYSALLKKNGISHHSAALCRNGITVEGSGGPALLPGFEEGLFFVQDAAAQHAVDRLGAKKGERVLDLCAAPGGKSFAAAMDMEGEGEIVSHEFYPSRLSLITKGAQRLGISIIRAEARDSSRPLEDAREAFDRVICDVPCSGYGTIAKKPDIRHKPKSDADALPPLQEAILDVGARALKKGGRLLYSTCTLNPKENENVTDRFLSLHPEFVRVGEAETLFPKGGENDGFFCDLLEKKL
ncbi:MAG: 16S rRNA (cytosine(967)-C(5))-methyltransferase RsmB [Clostridia bacterium]|nr:16S rRNA (cytosine(967)-C(5))-methyltransferase RsmB [Clostridia bacterium]